MRLFASILSAVGEQTLAMATRLVPWDSAGMVHQDPADASRFILYAARSDELLPGR